MKTRELIEKSFVCDVVWPIRPQYDNTYESLDRFRKAGFDMVSVTLAGDQHNISEAVQMVASHRRQVIDRSDRLVLFKTLGDLDRARAEGKLCVMFHFEGSRPYERNIDMIGVFFDLGIRFNLLAFNNTNSAGGGAVEAVDPGLTAYGRRVVREMDRVGMALDLSHTGRKTSMEAMALYSKPPIFSHHGSDAVFSHPRNLTDAQLKACAERGGVAGVSGANMYLGNDDCSPERLFAHIDHIAGLVGAEHIGFGFDVIFNGAELDKFFRARPEEWPFTQDPNWPGSRTFVPEQLDALVGLMVEHGYTDDQVTGIVGGNFKRVFAAHWA
ncbi:MAG: membrane dipeptidase [Roseitalea sp.]|jgi:membrane dipeptidase|nr:membrane dipeptidase [Roseitalea sp.]MBO6721214.1 membrane dipeptidase [Roseitalea sp.]MBO6744272.1 membrane dipeptidase [Roseitalea sp.]